MDFDAWYREHPNAKRDMSPVIEIADSRLGKQENGMVLIPRTFYNKHPAMMVVPQRRQSARSNEGIKKTSTKRVDANNGFESDHFEYRLVLCPPESEPSPVPPSDFSLEVLSNEIDDGRLPSQMWEVERIPPPSDAVPKPDGYDSIAAELEALMGEQKKVENDDAPDKPESEEIKETPMELCTPVEPTQKPEAEKEHDEYPSIMEILNEMPTPAKENNVEVAEEMTKMETDEEKNVEEPKQNDVDAQGDKPKIETQTDADDTKTVETDNVKSESLVETVKKTNNNEYALNSIIFRRYTPDKQTYDRLVTFQQNMEYFISVDDKKIELLGAPEFIANVEDLQILLQIVDSIDLNSFNVLLKS